MGVEPNLSSKRNRLRCEQPYIFLADSWLLVTSNKRTEAISTFKFQLFLLLVLGREASDFKQRNQNTLS